MLGILGFGTYLLVKKDLTVEGKSKIATYFLSSAHTQLLTGFLLFFLLMSEVNHMKIGIKMILAIEIAITATIYKKKLNSSQLSQNLYLVISLVSAVIVTAIAFLW
jgi:hypothetical protein